MHPFVMSKSIFVLMLIFFSGKLAAQETFRFPTYYQSLGNVSVSLQSPLSFFSNPEGISNKKRLAFGFQYENRFLLDALCPTPAFLILPIFQANLGFSLSPSGNGFHLGLQVFNPYVFSVQIFNVGFGCPIVILQTDLTFSYHQYLYYFPSFSIYYQLS